MKKHLISFFGIAVGAFFAALSIQVFLYPNQLIDGGIIGIALILARLLGAPLLAFFLIVLNIPFVYLAYRYIRKSFVFHMLLSILFFALFLFVLQKMPAFHAESLEIIALGGVLLGAGVGLMIRHGGCTDGTEILGILINRKFGFTVGQTVFFFNIFIFSAYGAIFHDWHIAVKSLLTYLVAFKMIDLVIAGFEELKSVLIITSKSKELRDLIMNKLGLGLTIIPSFGGFSGESKDILLVIIERLDLSELREIVITADPQAFLAIQNLSELAYGRQLSKKARSHRKGFFRI